DGTNSSSTTGLGRTSTESTFSGSTELVSSSVSTISAGSKTSQRSSDSRGGSNKSVICSNSADLQEQDQRNCSARMTELPVVAEGCVSGEGPCEDEKGCAEDTAASEKGAVGGKADSGENQAPKPHEHDAAAETQPSGGETALAS
ncbi:unnamed protein product, partial [Amoebophrya sp. A120]